MQNDKVYINARFLRQQVTGVQRYAIEISRRLKVLYGNQIIFVAPKGIVNKAVGRELNVVFVGRFSGYFWEQIELPLFLKSKGSPLLVNLCNMAPLLYRNKLITIHDMAFLDLPVNFSWQFRTVYQTIIPKLAATAKHVVTVSEFSKSRTLHHLTALNEEDISVIPNGVDLDRFASPAGQEREKYILSVASGSFRKNIDNLVRGFHQFNKSQNEKYKLYLVGDDDRIFEKQPKQPRHESVLLLGRVDDQELSQSYAKAALFLNLSSYEGFGVPVLEALAHNTPTVCSDIEVYRELFQDAVVFVDPNNPLQIAEGIAAALSGCANDPRAEKAKELVNRFNWTDSSDRFSTLINKFS